MLNYTTVNVAKLSNVKKSISLANLKINGIHIVHNCQNL